MATGWPSRKKLSPGRWIIPKKVPAGARKDPRTKKNRRPHGGQENGSARQIKLPPHEKNESQRDAKTLKDVRDLHCSLEQGTQRTMVKPESKEVTIVSQGLKKQNTYFC